MESQRLLPPTDAAISEESFEDDWTDRSSCSNSYSDSDDSTIPDWEPYVDDHSGSLLYIDCHPFVTHSKDNNKPSEQPEIFSKTQLRRSTRGKFLRLLRRRESKRYSKKGHKPIEEGSELNTQKVKFQDFQEGEQKVVTLEIESENRYNLSGDKSLAESLLGVIVSTLSDGTRVMIAVTATTTMLFCLSNYIDYAQYKDFNSTVSKPLPLPIWFPFDPNNHYTAAFVIGVWLTLVGTIYNVVTQVLFLTLMTYAALQLKALKIYGKDFHQFCVPFRSNSSEYNEEKVLKVFRNICVKHQDIIRFIDELNSAMRNVLFLEYLLNSLNIASVMIRILMMFNTPAMLAFCVALLLHQIMQLFWMSWHANEIQLQSVSLSDALFQSKWYEQSEKVKRVVFIMMMRSRKPLRILIGPFFPMSIRTALATMKAAYSYVTLIVTMTADD